MPGINKCYSDALEKLDSDIALKTSDRSREYRINLLAEEIKAVLYVVEKQINVFRSIQLLETDNLGSNDPPRSSHAVQNYLTRTRSRPSPSYSYYAAQNYTDIDTPVDVRIRRRTTSQYPTYDDDDILEYNVSEQPTDFRLLSTDPNGHRILLFNECLMFLNERKSDFDNFYDWTNNLKRRNRNKIDTTKDRHDNAIYAFTIVTIVFLPLSAVASIFGMNTNDVRNMDLNQWAYWTTAVPITAVVIFLGLLWTGELGNIVQWIQSFNKRQQRDEEDYDMDRYFRDSSSR